MTKERRLAIEMWEKIRDSIENETATYLFLDDDIYILKNDFLHDKGLCWESNCWFCHYIRNCEVCPLGHCDTGSALSVVMNPQLPTANRVASCDYIIEALRGNVHV